MSLNGFPKCASLQACKYASVRVYKYASVQVYKYASIKIYKLGQRQSQTPFSNAFWVQIDFRSKKVLGPKKF